MKKIVISINPEYVKNIINGTKKFEYRTKAAKADVKSIIIYETTPKKKIVAEAEIIDVLEMTPEDLWKETSNYSGVSKEFFDKYFHNREKAYAYKLGRVKVFDRPYDLVDFGIKTAPQSFVYVQSNVGIL